MTRKLSVDETAVALKDFYLIFGDGSRINCELLEGSEKGFEFICNNLARADLINVDGVLLLEISSIIPLGSTFIGEFSVDISGVEKVLALSLHPRLAQMYGQAFGYYNALAVDRTPSTEKPSDAPEYPPKPGSLSYIDFVRSFPCWTYPVVTVPELIPQYTVFALLRLGNRFGAVATWSNGDLTAYIGEGLKVRLFAGSSRTGVRRSAVLSLAFDDDPYRAVEKVVERASRVLPLKLRKWKKKPEFVNYLGWCSWNAFLTDDLNHENVIKIVRGLIERSVPVKWAIIDDGWQKDHRQMPVIVQHSS